MPKGPHDSAENYFADLLHDMESAHVLTKSEKQSLRRSTRDICLPLPHSGVLPPGHLGEATLKVPDVAFEPRKRGPSPYLVVEVGFSQVYDSPTTGGLLQDARHWLEQTEGAVKCVVLVSITENKDRHEPHQGPNKEEDVDDMDCDSDEDRADSRESSIMHYGSLLERFRSSPSLIARYAGSFTAFVEVWRYSSTTKQIFLAQPRVVFLLPVQIRLWIHVLV